MRTINKIDHFGDLRWLENHEVTDLKLSNAGAVTHTLSGEVVLIINVYSLMPEHRTIISSAQIEAYKNVMDD